MQSPHLFLLMRREVVVRIRVRDQNDQLWDAVGFSHAKKFVGHLRRRDQLEAEVLSIERERYLDVGRPQDDLGDALYVTHAATAEIIAARLVSRTRGGTEQPGASTSPRPPVSSTARRASSSIRGGGP